LNLFKSKLPLNSADTAAASDVSFLAILFNY